MVEKLRDKKDLKVQTSGSTGSPKTIELPYSTIKASAEKTNEFFGLNENKTSMLCLSPNTIAGKMMIARAYFGGYEIICQEPNSNPLEHSERHFDFIAMVPLQLKASLKHMLTMQWQPQILIGGGPIPDSVKKELIRNDLTLYHSYGMTETASHVAIKTVNADSPDYYVAVNGVRFRTNENQQLIIDSPDLGVENLVTNDCVELLSPTTFRWLGRSDFVINSGGVKIHPEVLEKKWNEILDSAMFLCSEPDETLGERLVGYFEGEEINLDQSVIKSSFHVYEIPKAYYLVSKFERSESGKILKEETKRLTKKKFEPLL